ncbi:hypothetical protein BH10PAT1_BH10PAT1_0180 [soil metagenome]
MVNIVLNTEPTENEELILKEAEFEELANIFPTVNKLVVLGFFVNVASQSK